MKMNLKSAHGERHGKRVAPRHRRRTPEPTARINPILAQAKARIERSVPASIKERYLRLIGPEFKQLWSEQFQANLNAFVAHSITVPEEVPEKVAKWTLRVNRTENQEQTPLEPSWYLAFTWAMLYITCDVLEYVEQKKRFPVDRQVLDRTTALVKNELAWRYGIPTETA